MREIFVKMLENDVTKSFADNFGFLEAGFGIAFTLLIHDENI